MIGQVVVIATAVKARDFPYKISFVMGSDIHVACVDLGRGDLYTPEMVL